MRACPDCGERMWQYDGDIWTCRNGHHTRLDDGQPLVAVHVRQPILPFALTVLTSGVVAVLLIELLH